MAKRIRIKNRRIEVLKSLFMLFVLFMLMCVYLIRIRYINKNDYVDLNNTQISIYIKTADEVSEGRLQVNWKYMAAIDGVRYKKDYSQAQHEKIKLLAEMFLQKNSTSNNYKLLSLDNVLSRLSFTDEQKQKSYKYLKQLDTIGIAPNNLSKDSECRAFINELTPKAEELYKKYKILPSITISQAIMESGWGKSNLSVKANNLFGIKADSNWKGHNVNMDTGEYYDKVIKADFRKYKNKTDSIDDYGEFLYNNERYRKHGFFDASQYIGQAQAIEEAGYGTNSDKDGNNIYADLLIKVIRENDLQLIDSKVQTEK